MPKAKRKACSADRVSPEQLWDMFFDKFPEEDGERTASPYEFDCLGPKFVKDLAKVEFDFENYEFSHLDEFGIWKGMLGYRKFWTHNPLTCFSYIGWMAGGDWEQPVYFIVYLDKDGKTFRAYIPKDGNIWNHKTKQAIGNDEDADDAFLTKWVKKNRPELVDEAWEPTVKQYGKTTITSVQYGSDDGDVMFDPKKIEYEMMFRFEAVK